MRMLYPAWLLMLPLVLAGCSAYQEKFGGKSYKYDSARPQAAIKLPAKAMPKSDRFVVPDVPGKWQPMVTEIVVPE